MTIMYRLVRTNPPTDADFRSYRSEDPTARYSVTECQARGVSVYGGPTDAAKNLAFAKFRGWLVCRVVLAEGAGWIQQTGSRSHHTWWPLAEYDIVANCEVN